MMMILKGMMMMMMISYGMMMIMMMIWAVTTGGSWAASTHGCPVAIQCFLSPQLQPIRSVPEGTSAVSISGRRDPCIT